MPSPNFLSERHRKAICAFLSGMSKKNSCLEAGYAPSVDSSDIFGREDVRAEIQRRQRQMSSKAGVDADWIIERLKAIADAQLMDMMVLDEEGIGRISLDKMTPQLRRALTGYEVKANGEIRLKLADTLKALDMLARQLGMYQDKVTVEGELSLIERLQAGRDRAAAGNDLENQTGHTSESTT